MEHWTQWIIGKRLNFGLIDTKINHSLKLSLVMMYSYEYNLLIDNWKYYLVENFLSLKYRYRYRYRDILQNIVSYRIARKFWISHSLN